MPNTNSLAGSNDDLRTDSVTIFVPNPVEGTEVPIDSSAVHAYDVTKVRRKTAVGDCDLIFKIDGEEIEFEDSQTDFSIPASTGALDLATPDSTDDDNHHVAVGSKLTVLIDNVASFTTGLEIQVVYELDQVNTT